MLKDKSRLIDPEVIRLWGDILVQLKLRLAKERVANAKKVDDLNRRYQRRREILVQPNVGASTSVGLVNLSIVKIQQVVTPKLSYPIFSAQFEPVLRY